MDNEQALNLISASFPRVDRNPAHTAGQLQIVAPLDQLPELMAFLRDSQELRYDMLSDVTAVDYPSRTPRFDLIYILYSTVFKHRLVIKCAIDDGVQAPSMSHLWASANWGERECFDLMGIPFANHPDLRRILTWDNFEGHPLRKEFPLKGKDFDQPFDHTSIVVLSAFEKNRLC